MKKKLIALLCLMGMLSLGVAGVACGDKPNDSNGSDMTTDTGSDTGSTHEHVYGEAAYTWENDTCTAIKLCTGDDCEENVTETVTGVYVKDTDATCAENEKGHYEATFENEAFTTQATAANSVEVPDTKTEHAYGETTYVWDGDTCTATRVCSCTDMQTETVTGVYVKDTDATCSENEKGHYEATFENEAFTTQATAANSVEVPETAGHVASSETVYNAETRQNATVCVNCGEQISAVNVYKTYESGSKIEESPTAIPMADLVGKAISFDFKIDGDGSFAFAIMSSSWANATGTLSINKSGDSVTANFGLITVLEGGWYNWKLNHSAFAGDGLANATDIGLIYHQDIATTGTVHIDWTSFKVVDSFVDRTGVVAYANGTSGISHNFARAIAIKEIAGKAFSFDFNINGDGSFTFSAQSWAWANLTGDVTITKSGDSVTATQGRVVALEEGWYSWQINYDLFHGDGFNRKAASEIAFLYIGNAISGAIQIDKGNAKVVDAYAYDRTAYASKFTDGQSIGQVWLGASSILKSNWDNQWAGFTFHFEFKFETDGQFDFAAMANDWANVTGTITITKSGDNVTANQGSIIALGDGWYAFEINAADFAGDGASRATGIEFVYTDSTVSGTVWINWHFKALPTA